MEKASNNFTGNIIKGIGHRLRRMTGNKYKNASLNWFSIKKLKHLPYNQPNDFKLKGHTIRFNNGPELLHSLKEIFVQEVYKTTFPVPDPYIIDCGSNIGLSVLYFHHNFPHAEIDAFEPDPDNYALLKRNIPANSRIRLNNEAIWKEDTTLRFTNDGTLGSKIGETQGSRTIEVKARRLKNMLTRKVDFLKLDIEGAEYEVLNDCAGNLKNVSQLFIEFHGHFNKMHELTGILKLVEDNGFAFYIKEASSVYDTPFYRQKNAGPYDLQLNIFCFRNK